MRTTNFSYLFVGLLLVLGIEPFLEGLPNSGALIQSAFSGILVAGVFSLRGDGRVFHVGLALAAISLVAAVGYLITGGMVLRIVDLAAILAFCVLAIGVKLEYVLTAPGPITRNRLVGALCIYLLLGVTWAILFGFVEIADPDAFSYQGVEPGDPLEAFLYYSFVTLTTLGYGDVTPLHPVARTLAYLEAVIGQLYLAVLIATLVGRLVASRDAHAQA